MHSFQKCYRMHACHKHNKKRYINWLLSFFRGLSLKKIFVCYYLEYFCLNIIIFAHCQNLVA